MERLIVEGGHPLQGEIVPAGNKNSAQPMLAACLLTPEPITLRNVPNIEDVRTLLDIIEGMGVEVDASGLTREDHTVTLRARRVDAQPDRDLGSRVRGSMLMAGPLPSPGRPARPGPPGGGFLG